MAADDLALPLVEEDAADRTPQAFEGNRLALAPHGVDLEIIVRMAVSHRLHGVRRQHRIVILRPEGRQETQKLRKIDPLFPEIGHREVVFLADIPEILLLGGGFGPHQLLQLPGLTIAFAELHDPPLDQCTVQPEIGLVRIVIGRNLVVGERRVDAPVHIQLVQLADQQRLTVLLDHLVDIVARSRKQRLGLLELELLAHPPVHVYLHERRAVFARDSLGNHRLHIAQLQLLAAGARQRGIAGEIARHLPAARQKNRSRHDCYFRSQIHNPEDKDTVFTRN